MEAEKIIGIVGGAGPFAGLDLQTKILNQTDATQDQEHLTIINLSQPNQLTDRTAFLLGETAVNPAQAIFQQLQLLERAGTAVAAIPCNTAHAPVIFDVVLAQLKAAGSRLTFLNMVYETAQYIHQHHPGIKRIGVLSTTGTYRVRIYPDLLETIGFEVLVPDEVVQKTAVQPAIYHPQHGIKACGKATPQSRNWLLQSIHHLQQQGAEAIILGCTELPLAITENRIETMQVIDPTTILARALIREANPAKLRPLL
ncbi:MAG: aspartate/glutamate racemase family protein [Ardenticatenaceae bacterium]|nr:aspartate/glutamate racemase family protein [Ardenticatenaceae bacterium]MCB9443703.1 aspartate/glutamate racemase family protein [Ardenticatenaceae bacterium]